MTILLSLLLSISTGLIHSDEYHYYPFRTVVEGQYTFTLASSATMFMLLTCDGSTKGVSTDDTFTRLSLGLQKDSQCMLVLAAGASTRYTLSTDVRLRSSTQLVQQTANVPVRRTLSVPQDGKFIATIMWDHADVAVSLHIVCDEDIQIANVRSVQPRLLTHEASLPPGMECIVTIKPDGNTIMAINVGFSQ